MRDAADAPASDAPSLAAGTVDGAPADPVDEIGPAMRDRRKAVGLTLSEVAERAGLSVGHLSQVERGLSTPTIRQLQGIARALGVTIGWFFRADVPPEPSEEDDVVVRAGRRRRVGMPSLGIVDELLVPDLERALELLHCTLEPGAGSGSEPYTHEGEEAGVILAGEMELWVDERLYRLKTGDSFAFASTRPHRYRNAGTVPLRLVWAITPPSY
ncbi:helix-turn-helix domain-containing protein [Mangrovibrevibacter kandeliae]|uniref:helix-turn-helix domain-containing protein n=1 Tax=Mangrovibrevibacter kandeliae TaxID=2968473 RepID=UPI002117F794|nr:cupin domain-containing protein [Aurantimonas sp. CSK15Z-1]MCQ8781996.1 cupin domain-containing protein [Aurantimonas sp. CSK15Z-1]